MRVWTLPADFLATQMDLTKAIKQRFDAEGISIPFPQRDVHLDTLRPLQIRLLKDDPMPGAQSEPEAKA